MYSWNSSKGKNVIASEKAFKTLLWLKLSKYLLPEERIIHICSRLESSSIKYSPIKAIKILALLEIFIVAGNQKKKKKITALST